MSPNYSDKPLTRAQFDWLPASSVVFLPEGKHPKGCLRFEKHPDGTWVLETGHRISVGYLLEYQAALEDTPPLTTSQLQQLPIGSQVVCARKTVFQRLYIQWFKNRSESWTCVGGSLRSQRKSSNELGGGVCLLREFGAGPFLPNEGETITLMRPLKSEIYKSTPRSDSQKIWRAYAKPASFANSIPSRASVSVGDGLELITQTLTKKLKTPESVLTAGDRELVRLEAEALAEKACIEVRDARKKANRALDAEDFRICQELNGELPLDFKPNFAARGVGTQSYSAGPWYVGKTSNGKWTAVLTGVHANSLRQTGSTPVEALRAVLRHRCETTIEHYEKAGIIDRLLAVLQEKLA